VYVFFVANYPPPLTGFKPELNLRFIITSRMSTDWSLRFFIHEDESVQSIVESIQSRKASHALTTSIHISGSVSSRQLPEGLAPVFQEIATLPLRRLQITELPRSFPAELIAPAILGTRASLEVLQVMSINLGGDLNTLSLALRNHPCLREFYAPSVNFDESTMRDRIDFPNGIHPLVHSMTTCPKLESLYLQCMGKSTANCNFGPEMRAICSMASLKTLMLPMPHGRLMYGVSHTPEQFSYGFASLWA